MQTFALLSNSRRSARLWPGSSGENGVSPRPLRGPGALWGWVSRVAGESGDRGVQGRVVDEHRDRAGGGHGAGGDAAVGDAAVGDVARNDVAGNDVAVQSGEHRDVVSRW